MDGTAVRHLALAFAELATIVLRGAGWRRGAEIRLCGGDGAADPIALTPATPANGRMVIEIGKSRRVIVDAGVDAAALARVLAILERR